ncbi:MAG: hypothetical protein IJ767_07625 [Bacteroidaceae bacterium]|nr:hypothetical protein [Bacteroidaceae bacterium]MBR1801338.1 hypothetical protein [Bacteroidaceae bacterium]
MKKLYSTPQTKIFHVQIQNALMQVSMSEKEISGEHAGLSKESNSDWGDIWSE